MFRTAYESPFQRSGGVHRSAVWTVSPAGYSGRTLVLPSSTPTSLNHVASSALGVRLTLASSRRIRKRCSPRLALKILASSVDIGLRVWTRRAASTPELAPRPRSALPGPGGPLVV